MNKFIAVAAAGALAVVASFAATAPSSAFYPGPGFGAGFIGFAAGAALASAAHHDHYYGGYRGADIDWRDHVAACEDAYRSYDPRSDTFVDRRGYEHQCDL